ncbi:MAG: hypothetical protein SCALA702_28960 [Melioribacteraceae bacterium]|nr:MAG: hypothetical protein SCALA702_28960 [Melioribacteraceae bacterium]
MKLILKFMFLLTGLAILASCQDDPGPIGSSLIPDSDLVVIDSLDNSNFNFELKMKTFKDDSVDIGSSNTLLLGNYDDIKSSILIQYYIFLADSLSEALDDNGEGLIVMDAWVELDRRYAIGDEASAFEFTAHRITREWAPNDFTDDELQTLLPDIETGVDLKTEVSVDDSIMAFHFDTDVALDWIKHSYDTTLAKNYGVYITPTPAAAKTLGFYGLSSANVDNISRMKMVIQKPGEFIDTVTSTVSGDVHVNSVVNRVSVPGTRLLQGGIPQRSMLSFNLADLPRDIIINNAKMVLHFDEVSSDFGDPEFTTLYAQLLADSTDYNVDTDYGTIQFIKDSGTFEGNITTFVQYWQNGLENFGLKFYIANDIGNVSKVVLYGPDNSDAALVPELVITYTAQR